MKVKQEMSPTWQRGSSPGGRTSGRVGHIEGQSMQAQRLARLASEQERGGGFKGVNEGGEGERGKLI